MAQVILPRWKSDLSALFFRSDPRVENLEISLMTANVDYRISLDVSHFGSQLPVQDILLEFPKTPAAALNDANAEASAQGASPAIEVVTAPPTPTQLTYRLLPVIEEPTRAHSSISSVDSRFVLDFDSNKNPCIVCMEERSPDQFPAGKITEYCHHESITCFTCLEYSIASDHRSKFWDNISCPQCYTRLSYHDVKEFADPVTFEHYDSLCNREALSTLPNFVWCLGCDSGQIHEDGEICPAVTCAGCNAVSCFNHKVPWHKGLSCDQYDRLINGSALSALKSILSLERYFILISANQQWIATRISSAPRLHFSRSFSYKATNSQYAPPSECTSASDLNSVVVDVKQDSIAKIRMQSREQKASIRRIKQVCKRCPGSGCNWPIQKIDGCKHMTCLKCSFEFCWKCRRSWIYGHKCWKWW